MSSALLRKELRELRPWALLAVVFGCLDLLDELTRATDQRPLGDTFHSLSNEGVGLVWLLAFAIGTTLGTREEDDGTLAFLDGLPLTRSRVFLIKLLVATGVLLTYPVLKLLLVAGLHLLSRGSLDHALHPTLLLQLLGVELLLVFSGLSFGAALGRLRSLTWLVLGCLAVGMALLTERVPRAALFDPMALAEIETAGLRLRLDGELIMVQLLLAALWAVVAWASFVGAGRPRFPELSKRPVVSALVTVLTIAAVTWAVALRADDDRPRGGATGEAAPPRFAQSAPASTSTAHYRFSYPALQAREALALAERADAIFEEVHRLLQVAPGAVIDVDASGSRRDTAGTAHFGGLRLRLGPDVRGVLAHETCHVVSRRVAGDERAWLWSHALVLNEGLASWVERRFDPREEGRLENRLALAALHGRGELLLPELVDVEALSRARDELLKYSAGEALIDATVRVYGVEALPRLMAAFGDQRLPPSLEGLALWQACFQLAGMDLGRVVDEFFREVETDVEAHEDELAELPRPRVVLLSAEGWYGAKAVVEAPLPEGWQLALRFRAARDSPSSTYDTFTVAPGQPEWQEKDVLPEVILSSRGDRVPRRRRSPPRAPRPPTTRA